MTEAVVKAIAVRYAREDVLAPDIQCHYAFGRFRCPGPAQSFIEVDINAKGMMSGIHVVQVRVPLCVVHRVLVQSGPDNQEIFTRVRK